MQCEFKWADCESPFLGGTDDIAGDFKYEDLIFMAKSAMESPYVRRMKMLSKSV